MFRVLQFYLLADLAVDFGKRGWGWVGGGRWGDEFGNIIKCSDMDCGYAGWSIANPTETQFSL